MYIMFLTILSCAKVSPFLTLILSPLPLAYESMRHWRLFTDSFPGFFIVIKEKNSAGEQLQSLPSE